MADIIELTDLVTNDVSVNSENKDYTPHDLFEDMLDNDEIKATLVLNEYQDGSVDVNFSYIPLNTILLMHHILGMEIDNIINQTAEET